MRDKKVLTCVIPNCPGDDFSWRGYTFSCRKKPVVIVDHDPGDEDRSE